MYARCLPNPVVVDAAKGRLWFPSSVLRTDNRCAARLRSVLAHTREVRPHNRTPLAPRDLRLAWTHQKPARRGPPLPKPTPPPPKLIRGLPPAYPQGTYASCACTRAGRRRAPALTCTSSVRRATFSGAAVPSAECGPPRNAVDSRAREPPLLGRVGATTRALAPTRGTDTDRRPPPGSQPSTLPQTAQAPHPPRFAGSHRTPSASPLPRQVCNGEIVVKGLSKRPRELEEESEAEARARPRRLTHRTAHVNTPFTGGVSTPPVKAR